MQRIEYSQVRQGPVGHLTERLWCPWRGHRWDFAYQQAEFARIAETAPGGLFLRAVEIPAVEWTTHRCPRCDLLRAVGVVLADGDGGADFGVVARWRRSGSVSPAPARGRMLGRSRDWRNARDHEPHP